MICETYQPVSGQTNAELEANLLDVHNQRLAGMDATGIDFVSFRSFSNLEDALIMVNKMVLSCAAPGIQGIMDPANASATATLFNNQLASVISNNTARFGAFAALSMHDPAGAAAELNRTVKELGFLGALVNDYQVGGTADNGKHSRACLLVLD